VRKWKTVREKRRKEWMLIEEHPFIFYNIDRAFEGEVGVSFA